jgi:hypothetical protein
MAELIWDKLGEREYESGVDRAVLYLRDGRVIPWSGIVSVEEAGSEEGEPLHYDGFKYAETSISDDYAATVRAITFPDEMLELEGMDAVAPGMYAGEQPPQPFNFAYRTRVGDDIQGDESGYKLHLVYNVIAVPDTKGYSTVSNEAALSEFGWNLTTIPETLVGFKPTAHVIVESTPMNRFLLRDLEEMIWGTETANPSLPVLQTLGTYVSGYEVITIVDHGDGTWPRRVDQDDWA